MQFKGGFIVEIEMEAQNIPSNDVYYYTIDTILLHGRVVWYE